MHFAKSLLIVGVIGSLATPAVVSASSHHNQQSKKHKEKCDAEGKACKHGHDCKAEHCKAKGAEDAPMAPAPESPAPAPAPAPGMAAPESPAPAPSPAPSPEAAPK